MISYYLPSGGKIGVGYEVHALANALAARGHGVTVFISRGPSAGARSKTKSLSLNGSNRTFKFALRLRHVDWARFDVLLPIAMAIGCGAVVRGPTCAPFAEAA
jgi:nucleoside-diphosphate-sugar epimerase